MSRVHLFLTIVISLCLIIVSAVTSSAQTTPEVRVKAVAATFPDKVNIVEVSSYGPMRNSQPAAAFGEKWMVVKATAFEKTNWGGFALKNAVINDAAGNSYPAKAVSLREEKQEFYLDASYILGNLTTVLFLFSIPVNSKGLKFSAGGVELPIRQSPPATPVPGLKSLESSPPASQIQVYPALLYYSLNVARQPELD